MNTSKTSNLTGNDQKQIDLVMQTSLHLLPLIMNNIPQAVFWKDRNLVYLGCNQAFADDAGFSSPEDVVGKTDFDMPWKAQAELYRADNQRVIETGEPKLNYEEPQTMPNGSTNWVRTSLIPVRKDDRIVAVLGMYEDITARKQVEADLLLRDRALASSLNAVIIVNISDNKPVYVNDALLKMTGHTREEVMQIGLSDITGNAEEAKKIRAAIQAQGFFVGEELLKRKDGSVFPANFFSSLIIGAEGRPVAVQSTFFDITERKKAEETIHESEERFRRFTEATIEGLVFHEQGKIIDANPAALAMFGLSENSQFFGRNLLEFIVPESHKLVLQQMQLETVLPYEILCFRADGSTFPVETSTRIYNLGGRTIRASSIRDITERKRAEESLRQSEATLSSALQVANMGHWEYDIATEMFTLNDQYYSLHGMTVQQAGGYQISLQRFAQEFVWPEDGPIVGQATQQAIETKDPNFQVQIEARVMHNDGKPRWMAVWFRIEKDAQGQTVRLHGVNQDITERKQAEQKLQENQQLLQLVMDNIPQSVFWKDKNLTYLGVNQAFAEDAGFASPQEIVGRNDFDMPWKEQAALYRADDQRVLDGGEPKLNYEEPQTGPTGQVTWLRTSKIPMRDANGNIFAVLGMYEDITESKRLQQQVQEAFERRGYQVQVSNEISQEVAAAPELNELFELVVTLTKERLGYYHTQLLRYSTAQDAVVLISGYGETGHKMLTDGHKMPMGSGLIGTAAATGETVIRPTLADDPDWQPNPLLPETKGEIAVPIKWQDTVLGVLDVQSDRAGALSEDDRLLLEGLCGQIAIAMHNAELVETVRQNEARLAEALKTARLANWEYDVEKDLFTFNDQFYSIFHTTAEKAGGYQLSSARYAELFVHPDDLEVVGTEIGKALSSKERVYNTSIDHRILYEDGGVGYITVKLTVERDEDGKITRYYGANQDITERKQAEEALRINEARLAEALKIARLGNWEYDFENDLFHFTDEFYSIFRTTAEKVGGYKISSADYAKHFVHPDDALLVGAEIQKVLDAKDRLFTTHLEHRIIFADGETGYISVNINVERDENGKITRWYGANQDITERKQAEEALRRSEQEMADRLEEINRLYQNLSHEGWKAYRETADLPSGFVFDQTGTRPVEVDSLPEERFAQIPMKVLGGEVVGNLAVADDPQHPISNDDLDFLQQVSDQVALALEGARLTAQTQSALAQTEALYETSTQVARATTIDEVLRSIVELTGLRNFDYGSVSLFTGPWNPANPPSAVLAATWDPNQKFQMPVGTVFSMVDSPFNALPNDRSVYIADIETATELDEKLLAAFRQYGRSLAFYPLRAGDQYLGSISMMSAEATNLEAGDLRQVEALMGQAAMVVENRRQFERAQQQAERESMLNVISQKIQSATTVEAVLQIAARELGHALGAPMTIAQLSMKDKK